MLICINILILELMSHNHSLSGFMAFSAGAIILGILVVAVFTAEDPSEKLRYLELQKSVEAIKPVDTPLTESKIFAASQPVDIVPKPSKPLNESAATSTEAAVKEDSQKEAASTTPASTTKPSATKSTVISPESQTKSTQAAKVDTSTTSAAQSVDKSKNAEKPKTKPHQAASRSAPPTAVWPYPYPPQPVYYYPQPGYPWWSPWPSAPFGFGW